VHRLRIYKGHNVAFDIVKAFFPCHVVHSDAAVGVPQVRMSNRPVPLLSSCVPYLQLYNSIINLKCLYFEVNSYSARVVTEDAVGIPQ
jgi:hypothetical protein